MNLIKICYGNIETARNIQNRIFKNDAYINYLESIEYKSDTYEYWLLEVDGHIVGVSGIYSLKIDPESAWLGWFGILPEYRKLGFASQALIMFEAEALQRGFKYTRIYTARNYNDVAKKFYEHNGYKEEYYSCRKDPIGHRTPLSIYSKCLTTSADFCFWADKNLHLFRDKLKSLLLLLPDKVLRFIFATLCTR